MSDKTGQREQETPRRLTDEELTAIGRTVLETEAGALENIASGIGSEFVRAVRATLDAPGVIVSGVGKSGIVARKVAATFASTGTRAFFLHPGDAAHGDVGVVGRGDVVIAISKSGEGDELLGLLPTLNELGVTIIALTGDTSSSLAARADIVIDASVEREACPMDVVPTASTTAALALGDALAVAVLREKKIDRNALASFHPGGALGRRLLLKVTDVMHAGDELPVVPLAALMKDAVFQIAEKRLGMTTVIDGDGKLAGIVADGDLKRILMQQANILDARVEDVMTTNPRTIGRHELVASALEEMERTDPGPITSLIVVDDDGRPEGVIHIHDCLRAIGQRS